jgi:hypothetical protein
VPPTQQTCSTCGVGRNRDLGTGLHTDEGEIAANLSAGEFRERTHREPDRHGDHEVVAINDSSRAAAVVAKSSLEPSVSGRTIVGSSPEVDRGPSTAEFQMIPPPKALEPSPTRRAMRAEQASKRQNTITSKWGVKTMITGPICAQSRS